MNECPDDYLGSIPADLIDQAKRYWTDWVQVCQSSEIDHDIRYEHSRVAHVWCSSDFVARTCFRFPSFFVSSLEDISSPRSLSDYQEIIQRSVDEADNVETLMRRLRVLRMQEMMRIAWRDIEQLASLEQILAEISDLAEVIVSVALDFLHEDQREIFGDALDGNGEPQQMLILAMGKLGGRELNFSSDIDLIFSYPEDGQTDGRRSISNHEYFTKIARKLVKVLSEVTQDGFVYRVDTRLRPYGESGSLVCSFSAMENYYQLQGRDWERYAMIKAKIITGRAEDVEYLRALLKPFVFRRYLDFSAFESIREMKQMISSEVRRKGIEDNIKLGMGGIREIEFIGQTFQLVRGGRETRLQQRGILDVLVCLSELSLLSESQVSALIQAYHFHRSFENKLQMLRDKQTHLIPKDGDDRIRITLAMGLDSWEDIESMIEYHRHNVDTIFQNLMFSSRTGEVDDELNAFWFDNEMEGNVELMFGAWLEQQGIENPDFMIEHLNGFRKNARVRSIPEQSTKRLLKLLSMIISKLPLIGNVEVVFQRCLELLVHIVGRQVYINLLTEYPHALDLLLSLLSKSGWFVEQIAQRPILLDELVDVNYFLTRIDRENLSTELENLMSSVDDDDLETQMERLRQFKQARVLKVAALDLKDMIDVTEVADNLSFVAEVVCKKALSIALTALTKKHGQPQCVVDGKKRDASITIIAYGKLGGEELSYTSDLDIVFLHDSEGESQSTMGDENGDRQIDNMTFFARVAQKVIHIMEAHTHSGRLYEVDTRLRPDGRAGLMAVSCSSFERYQLEKAWTWEHQALVRARAIPGQKTVNDDFARIRKSVLQRPRSCEKIISDVVEMREKMREHLASKGPDQFDIKQDSGGLVDIEFIAQAGALCTFGTDENIIPVTSTLILLQRLEASAWLEKPQADLLREAYREYRWLVNRQALEADASEALTKKISNLYREPVAEVWQRLMSKT